jgi:hypothetical protein
VLKRGVIALVAVLVGPVAVSVARADTYRMVDGAGAVHLTNAPADPRYRGLPIVSGTATGWLRMPETARGQYAAEIREISARHGVDATLVESVIRAESAFNPTAVSRTGARGLMQLMPKTAVMWVSVTRSTLREHQRWVRHLRYLLDVIPASRSRSRSMPGGRGGSRIPPYTKLSSTCSAY